MAGDNGRSAPEPARERRLDLDAFVPAVSRVRPTVKVFGKEYPVRQMIHLTGREELDLDALERAIDNATTDRAVRRAMFDLAFARVRVLVPTMPEHVREGLQYEQALEVAKEAWAYADEANPPAADTGSETPAPAASSSPVSAVSSAATQAA